MISTDLTVLSRSAGLNSAQRSVVMPPTRWKLRVGVPILVSAVMAVLLAYGARQWLWPAQSVRVVPVMVRPALGGFVPMENSAGTGAIASAGSVQAPGWVEADPFATYVSGLADGVIREVLVLEGQPVEAQQVVARLVDEDARLNLVRAEAQWQQAQAEVAIAQAALTAAQQELEYLTERRRAQATTTAQLAMVRAELTRLPLLIAAEEARAVEMEQEWEFKQRLVDQNAVSELEGIQARNRAQAQRALAHATRAQQAVLEARLAELEAELAAASENLRLKTREVQAVDEASAAVSRAQASLQWHAAQREEAALRLARMEVRSPVSGIVMTLLKEPGDTLMLGGNMERSSQVMRIYDPSRLQVRVDIPLSDAAKVTVGQEARVVVGVLPDTTFDGHVTRVVHEADIQKNTVQVKVAIRNPGTQLKPEMLARVRFLAGGHATAGQPANNGGTASATPRVFVPEHLVIHEGQETFVWVVDSGRAARRAVALEDMRMDGWISVARGLVPGDRVIAGDVRALRSGAAVRTIGEAPLKGAEHGAH